MNTHSAIAAEATSWGGYVTVIISSRRPNAGLTDPVRPPAGTGDVGWLYVVDGSQYIATVASVVAADGSIETHVMAADSEWHIVDSDTDDRALIADLLAAIDRLDNPPSILGFGGAR